MNKHVLLRMPLLKTQICPTCARSIHILRGSLERRVSKEVPTETADQTMRVSRQPESSLRAYLKYFDLLSAR